MLPNPDATLSASGQSEGPIPAQIGRYRILGCLGTGGMGTVYKAQDPQLNRIVAVKLPRFDGPAQNVALRVQRFQREARAAASIRHPHVCPIYDVGEHEGQPYVVMGYIEGESLATRLASQGGHQDTRQAVDVIRQVLDALEAIHDHGIIHRDLKPSNILLEATGRAVLTDFGLARVMDDGEGLTSEGVVVGTPVYMAPEQARGQTQSVGPWTDLYSLGVILYQMLTGRLPFEGPALQVLARIAHESAPLPSSLRPDLDPAVEAIVRKAMAREPKERYQTARQFREALVGWASEGAKEGWTTTGPGDQWFSAQRDLVTRYLYWRALLLLFVTLPLAFGLALGLHRVLVSTSYYIHDFGPDRRNGYSTVSPDYGFKLFAVWAFVLALGLGIVLALLWVAWLGRWLPRRQAEALRYRLDGSTLRIDSGVYFLRRKAIPLDRITALVLVQGPLMRWVGIWGLRVQTGWAGLGAAGVILLGLKEPETVRDVILQARAQLAEVRAKA